VIEPILQAWHLHKNNNLSYLIDQRINNIIVGHEMYCVINVALLCVQQEATRHPLMSHVLAMLQGETNPSDVPSSSNQIDISFYMQVSTNKSNHLLAYPIPNNCNNVEIELTNLDLR
jgi:hypothetical protein